MAIKKIPISKLKPGMYVTKLDISWIDSPFMYHHLKIKNTKQIDKLVKAGVKNISIDTKKGDDIKEEVVETIDSSAQNNVSNTLANPPEDAAKQDQIVKVSIEKEMEAAKELQGQVTKLAHKINESLKNDEGVDTDAVTPLIGDTIDSLQRNNQALATLINMQRKGEALSNHAFATFSLVLSLALKLQLSDKEREVLAQAAFFHDAGWLKLPLHLLGKKTPYTANEGKLVQQHIALGRKTLMNNCELDPLVVRLIDEHHETLDGSGYPAKLDVKQLHPLSKLFTVVVRYDELVHGLLDKPAVTPHGALAVLYKEAKQGKLDEKSVSHLVSLLSVYPAGSIVELNNKEKGVVVEADHDFPKQPKVRIYYDIAGVAHVQPKDLDLAQQHTDSPLSIVAVLDIGDPSVDPAGLFSNLG